MKHPALLALVLAAGCGAFGGASDAPAETVVVEADDTPREPTTRSMDAANLASWLAGPAEHVRVVNFWATWCEPCLVEMPIFKEIAARHPEVEVVLVNVDHPSVQGPRVAHVRRSLGLEALSAVSLDAADPNADLRAHVPGWPEQIPWTLVIDRDGKVLARFSQGLRGPEVEASLNMASTPGGGPG